MSRGKASGYKLDKADASIVKGMVARGDRDHDVAAWFGVNQGRIAEVKDGSKFSSALIQTDNLPPKGPPGVKGRRLFLSVEKALKEIEKGADISGIDSILRSAIKKYNLPET